MKRNGTDAFVGAPKRAWALLVLASALLLAGCNNSRPGDVLRAGVEEPDELARVVARATTLTLTARDSTGAIVGGLARSWRVLDGGRSVVFRLRPAVDAAGRPVTAADVVDSLNAARRADAPMAPYLAGVTRVEAPVDSVIEVGLTTPQPELLEILADPALAIRIPGKAALRAGPFLPGRTGGKASEKAGARVLLHNPQFYAADDVALPRIDLAALPVAKGLSLFLDRKLDLYLGGDLADLEAAEETGKRPVRNGMLVTERRQGLYLLLVNQTRPALSDFRVRSALARAIDRVALGSALYHHVQATPAPGLVPGGIPGFPALDPDWANEPLVVRQDGARRLLAEAGFGTGAAHLSLTLTIPDRPAPQQLAKEIRRSLADVGVDLAIEPLADAVYRKALAKGDFALALALEQTEVASPLPFLLQFRCKKNPFGACLPEADRLVQAAWGARTFQDRMEVLAAAARLWAEDGTAIGLVEPVGFALVAPRVGGFAATASGVHGLRSMGLEPERRILK